MVTLDRYRPPAGQDALLKTALGHLLAASIARLTGRRADCATHLDCAAHARALQVEHWRAPLLRRLALQPARLKVAA